MRGCAGQGDLGQPDGLERGARVEPLAGVFRNRVGTSRQLDELGIDVAGSHRVELGRRAVMEPARDS